MGKVKMPSKVVKQSSKSHSRVKKQPKKDTKDEVPSIEEIKKLYQSTKASPKNVNDLALLLSGFEKVYTVLVGKSSNKAVEKYEEQCRVLTFSLFKTFENFIQTKLLVKSVKNEKDPKKVVLNKWLKARYESFKLILLSFVRNFKYDSEILFQALEVYMDLVKLESSLWAPKNEDEAYFPVQMYESLVKALFFESVNGEVLPDGTNNNVLLDFFSVSYLNKFKDLKYYFLSLVLNVLEEHKRQLDSGNFNQDIVKVFYSKWLTLMQEDFFHSIFYGPNEEESNTSKSTKSDEDDVGLSDDEDDDDSAIDASDDEEFGLEDTFVPNPPVSVQKYSVYKSLFTKSWLLILSFPGIHISQLKTTLQIIHKRVIPYLTKPEHLMDFLTSCYDNNDVLIVQVLALNGLFQLLQKKNLEYPSFYEKLYALCANPDILNNRFRSRFFRLLDLFLSSTHLPAAIVASFIKRLARLSVFNNPGGIVIVLPFVYNLLKRHPSCMILIHNPLLDDSQLENYIDPFNQKETNPSLTNAIDSSLWEFETLSTHYHPNVATLAKIYSNPFTKASYNIEDFLDWNYKGLLDSESSRRIKNENMMALEFETWTKISASENDDQNTFLQKWAF